MRVSGSKIVIRVIGLVDDGQENGVIKEKKQQLIL